MNRVICSASETWPRRQSLHAGTQYGALGVQDEGVEVEKGDPHVPDGKNVR